MSGSVSASKIVTYDVLAPEGAQSSKLVTYAALGPSGAQSSKQVTYAVLGTAKSSVSKLVSYAVLGPPPPIPLTGTLTITLTVAANSDYTVPMTAAPALTLGASGTIGITGIALSATPTVVLTVAAALLVALAGSSAPQGDNTDAYLAAYLALLPQGRIWNKEPGSNLYQVISALIPTFTRVANSAADLLVEGFVPTTDELLPEWQASLGLPDPCLPATATFEQQRAQAVSRLIGVEGQSVAFMIAYAANLGYQISVSEYTNFHVGASKVGASKIGDLAFSWVVNAPAEVVYYFKVGVSKVGEKLAELNSDVLQCELANISPAHTSLFFNLYSGSYLDTNFVLDESTLV